MTNFENGTYKYLNYLFNLPKEKYSKYLAVIEQSTGLGKSHANIRKVCEVVERENKSDKPTLFFLVSPTGSLRNETYQKCLKQLKKHHLEDQVVLLENEADLVRSFFRRLINRGMQQGISNTIAAQKDYLQNWIKHNVDKKYTKTIEILGYLTDLFVSDLPENMEAVFNDYVWKLKNGINADLGKEINKLSVKEREALAITSKRIQYLKTKMPFVIDLFPDIDLSNKSILVMTADKFVSPHKRILAKTREYYNETYAGRRVVLILDESDKCKVRWKDLFTSRGNKIDPIFLLRMIYRNVNKENVLERMILDSGNNRKRFQIIKKRVDQIYKDYNLQANIELSEKLEDVADKRFIFNTDTDIYLDNKEKQKLVISYDRSRNLNIIDDDPDTYDSQEDQRLDLLLARCNSFLRFFAKNVYSMSENFVTLKQNLNEKRVEKKGKDAKLYPIFDQDTECTSLIRSMLHLAPEDNLCNRIIEAYLIVHPGEITGKVPNSFRIDHSVYNVGTKILKIISNRSKSNDIAFTNYQMTMTPEKLLALIANKWRVILISATANAPSVLDNFDLNWVKDNVEQVIACPKEISAIFDQENKLKNQKILDKVNLHEEFLGKEYSLGTEEKHTNIELFKKLLQNLGLKVKNPEELLMKLHIKKDGVANDLVDPFAQFYTKSESKNLSSSIKTNDKSFYIGRSFKLLSAIIKFCQAYQQNHSRNSYICVLNANITKKTLDWLQEVLERAKLIEAGDPVLVSVQAMNYQEQIANAKKAWGEGKLRIVIGTNSYLSRGINLQYKLSEKFYQQYRDEFKIVSDRFNKDELECDLTGQYMELPTHIFEYNSKDKELQPSDALEYQYEQLSLYDSNCTDWTYKRVCWHILCYLAHDPVQDSMNNLQVVKDAKSVLCEQSLGRLDRCPLKNKNMYVLLDYELKDCLESSAYIRQKRTNVYIEKLRSTFTKDLAQKFAEENKKIAEKRELQAINKTNKFLLHVVYNLRNKNKDYRRSWIELRDFIAKHPVLNNLSEIPDEIKRHFAGLYLKFPTAVDRYYFSVKKDYEYLVAYGLDELAVREKARLDNENNRVYCLNWSNENKYLETILAKNKWIKEELEKEGYDLNFHQKGKYLLSPTAFNNLYKASISEKIGELVLKRNALDYHTMVDLSHHEFELFDGFINLPNDQTLYVDWKNYNSFKGAVSEKDNIEKMKNKLIKAEGVASVVINFYQYDAQRKYTAKRLVKPLTAGKIYVYPELFNHNGEENSNLILDLLKLERK